MPPETNSARTALVTRANDIPIHQWTGVQQQSDMFDFMNGLIEGKFDAGGLTGPAFEMTPIQWPEGGQGCTLDYNSDSTFGLDEVSEKYTIVFFTASPNWVHDIVLVRSAMTMLCIQLKITVGLQGERIFEGLSLAGDSIFSIPVHSVGSPYLCFAFVKEVKTHLLQHTQRISNSTKIVVLPQGAIDRPVDNFFDLMFL